MFLKHPAVTAHTQAARAKKILYSFMKKSYLNSCIKSQYSFESHNNLCNISICVSFHISNWSRRACVRHMWWRTKRSWPFLVQACLRAPHVVADEAKLAIVFTYFFLFFFLSFFFFSYAFCFSPISEKLP